MTHSSAGSKFRRLLIIAHLLAVVCLLSLPGCRKPEAVQSGRLQVVTTLFPLFDFARTIAGDKAGVTMLLPPGVEPHAFEPKPEDMIRINRAGLFIFTSPHMEPWAVKIATGLENRAMRVVSAGERVKYRTAAEPDQHGHGDRAEADPHIWLDFANAALMVDAILEGFMAADPQNRSVYRSNAELLKTRLSALDERYRSALADCGSRTLLHGGHYTFGYLAGRYGLEYHALSGISSDSEPTAARMAQLVREIRKSGVRYLFAEELLSPRLTETLAREAGVGVLMLHGAHNLSKEDVARNLSYFDLMERNLEQLKKGLQCRVK